MHKALRFCFLKHRVGRCVLLLISMLFVFVEVQAQMINLYVTNEEGKAIRKVKVYAFFKRADAEAAFKQASSTDPNALYSYGSFDKQKYKPTGEKTTSNTGYCSISVGSEGSIMLDGYDVGAKGVDYEVALFHIKDCVIEENNTITLVFKGIKVGPEKKQDGPTDFDKKVIKLNEVEKQEFAKMAETGGGVKRHGKNSITITRDLDVDADYARSDARFVAFPTIIFDDYEDSVTQMPPMAIDGVEYGRAMDRRMSFDKSRDLLNDFHFDGGVHLQHNQSERVTYSQVAMIKKGTRYHIPGILWYEDYNGVYHRDSILFSDGTESEPMRFLNWDEARKFADLDTELDVFKREGTVSSVADEKKYKLTFEQGRANLNMNDSATYADSEKMIQWLSSSCQSKTANVKRIVVRAYSSPEGSESRNRALSRERTSTIVQLLAGRLRDSRGGSMKNVISSDFDEYDNVVPWTTIADSMSSLNDSVAKLYAERIRSVASVHLTLDAQYRAIREQSDLYDYIDKNFLDRVRMVSVEAEVEEFKVLNEQEIIDLYYTEPNFVKELGHKSKVYMCYHILCYLAREEMWDELYEVSKTIYEAHAEELTVEKRIYNPEKNRLETKEEMVPYPLAGYYYALSCMRKGIVNKDILKPYLDDGSVSTAGPRHDEYGINLLSFIVAQVLMCCQDEAFDEANDLIKKYNLISQPDLTGLIMFVRCLDGQYESSEEVRQYVMSTSAINKAVILTAIEKYDEALTTLYYDDVPKDDAKVEYLKAICLFKKQNNNVTRFEAESMPLIALYEEKYDDEVEEEGEPNLIPTTWAVPMLNAFKLDEANVTYLKSDGYFNNAYRQMILYAWERMKAGVSLERISYEYKALVARMMKNKGKINK